MLIEGLILYVILLLLGMCIGVISGFFGIGGAFILTPILIMLGIPVMNAVATSLAFTVGVSIVGGYKHYKAGNSSVNVLILVSIFSLIGITIAKPILSYLCEINRAEHLIRIAFIFLLFFIAVMTYLKKVEENTDEKSMFKIMFLNILSHHKKRRLNEQSRWFVLVKIISDKYTRDKFKLVGFIKNIPPLIRISEVKKTSFWNIALIGVFVGFLKGFLGIGGGFLLVPLFVIILEMEVRVAVGTSILVLLISSIYASGLYLYDGEVEIFIVVLLTCGALISVEYGVLAINNLKESVMKNLYASFLLFAGIGIVLNHFGLEIVSIGYLILMIFIASVMIFYKYYYRFIPK